MKDPQNITICLLLAVAAILSAMLIGNFMTDDNAAYGSATVKQGDYILGTGARSSANDLIYVIDITARRLNVYDTNANNWTIDMVNTVDLDRAFRR